MHFLGIHIIDILIIVIFIFFVLWLGKRAGEKNKDTQDFFLAGRKLNKFYQFFLNFGCSTNADQAVATSREIYRQGIGGMWIQFIVLFLTPFYWFTTFFFRRSRLTTIGDFFSERFNSKILGAAYAVFILLLSLLGGGVGYMVAAKTMMAMTPKMESEYSPAEKLAVFEFKEYQSLKKQLDNLEKESDLDRYKYLNEKAKKGELKSFISHTHPVWFYFIYALIVGVYTMMGGFRAAAITDSIQGVLIIIFSIILIPVGLSKIGGFSGLHESVPDYMFELFGSATMSEYAWYTILAMALANLVSIVAVATGMQTAGSAKDENTARIGMIGGMFTKRLIMILWALAGLIAIGLYAGQLHDPDLIWGYMTKDLLFPGAIGLMLVGILAANMSTLDASSVSYSALFIRNLYKPVFPDKSEKHYLTIGRIVIGVTLLGGIGVAMYVDNLLELFKYIISIPAVFGAAIWLGFFWRKLTKGAVMIQAGICLLIYAIIPNMFPSFDSISHNPKYTIETIEKTVLIETNAMHSDVDRGLASFVGQEIQKEHLVLPVGIFFEKVVHSDPLDTTSPKIGKGRFQAEIWVVSWLGLDFSNWSKAQLVSLRFFFSALFPFLLLFLISPFTKAVPRSVTDRFFARQHTPVQATAEKEEAELAYSYANPARYDENKLFPKSQWEFMKPKRIDYIGFFGSWVLVGIIIFLLWLVVTVK